MLIVFPELNFFKLLARSHSLTHSLLLNKQSLHREPKQNKSYLGGVLYVHNNKK